MGPFHYDLVPFLLGAPADDLAVVGEEVLLTTSLRRRNPRGDDGPPTVKNFDLYDDASNAVGEDDVPRLAHAGRLTLLRLENLGRQLRPFEGGFGGIGVVDGLHHAALVEHLHDMRDLLRSTEASNGLDAFREFGMAERSFCA